MSDRLKLMPFKKWREMKSIFKLDFPRSIYAYRFLENIEDFEKRGLGYGTKVYCPMGDVFKGMVAVSIKNKLTDVILQCPRDNTCEFEEALRTTKLIDWKQQIRVSFAPTHVMSCLKRVIKENNFKINQLIPSVTLYLDKNAPIFDVSLPEDYSFQPLTSKYIQQVNENWSHKYPGSEWYFQLLIKANFGYGLFKGDDLLTWVFIKEGGEIGHLYTIEKYRKNSYGKLVTYLLSNIMLKNGKYVIFSCHKNNPVALNMYKQMGFTPAFDEELCYFTGSRN